MIAADSCRGQLLRLWVGASIVGSSLCGLFKRVEIGRIAIRGHERLRNRQPTGSCGHVWATDRRHHSTGILL